LAFEGAAPMVERKRDNANTSLGMC
jgi:hypothetical protein